MHKLTYESVHRFQLSLVVNTIFLHDVIENCAIFWRLMGVLETQF